MPCLAYPGPLTGRRWLVLVAGCSLARCSFTRCSLLAARHSWPISLARCSDEVGGFNDGYDVFDWFPVKEKPSIENLQAWTAMSHVTRKGGRL